MLNSEPIERREYLLHRVTEILARIEAGGATGVRESEAIDFKEEAGRRGRNGELQPGDKQNREAAIKLADEVCCLANTPGGGALILGVQDRDLQVIGTELDAEWLRHTIYEQVDIAPAVEVRSVRGQRLLIILVAESPEPIEDTSNKIRWRVGANCVPVDRAEWWSHRQQAGGYDEMARLTRSTFSDVSPEALNIARISARGGASSDLAAEPSVSDLLRLLGAEGVEGRLTQAGKLVFCSAGRPLVTLTSLDVHGGEVSSFIEGDPEQSLLEQLQNVETRLDVLNGSTTLSGSFSEPKVRDIPPRAVREAVLNGLIHRDWNSPLPTEVTWVDFDSTLVVRSPGGFSGGIDESNLLGNRHARYPALADLFRALGMVDKQGVGVDRMYQSMIVLGHRPPNIVQTAGPAVRCTLIGGKPVVPIVEMVNSIRPEARQRDYRVAIILDGLLHNPFLTLGSAMERLQADRMSAEVALRAATSSTIGNAPLVRQYKDVWVLGSATFMMAKRAKSGIHAARFLEYASTDRDSAREVIAAWLLSHDAITSGDLVEITRVSRPTATQILSELHGSYLSREGSGRSVRYRPSASS